MMKKNNKKVKKSKDKVKERILKSIVEGDVYRNGNLNWKSNKVKRYEDAAPEMKKYESKINLKRGTH